MKAYIFIFCLLAAISGSAQNDTITKSHPKPFQPISPEAAFKNDVIKNKIKIYLIGGLVSAVREKEREFEKKYNVTFHDFGCVVPGNLGFYDQYNTYVFEHITFNSGREWLADISPNAVGINKYKGKP